MKKTVGLMVAVLLVLFGALKLSAVLLPEKEYRFGSELYGTECEIAGMEDTNYFAYTSEDGIAMVLDGYSVYGEDRIEKVNVTKYDYTCTKWKHLAGNLYFQTDNVFSMKDFPDGTVPLELGMELVSSENYYFDGDGHYSKTAFTEDAGETESCTAFLRGNGAFELNGMKLPKSDGAEAFRNYLDYLDSLEATGSADGQN